MNKVIAVAFVTIAVSGCATQKNWSATGGSKSDGTIELSYQYGMFESPQVSEQQALVLAEKRCEAWGYEDAEAFGGQTRTCNVPSGSGCQSWLVTKTYQCVD